MKSPITVAAFTLYVLNTCAQIEPMNNALAYSERTDKLEAKLSVDIKNADNEFINYLKEAQDEIAGNEKRIAAMRSRLMDSNKNNNKSAKMYKKREKNIAILDIYNKELKADLNDYISFGVGDWKLFKKEFNRELEELIRDINELKHEYENFIAFATK